MSLQLEKLEKSMAKMTIEVPAEEFEAAVKAAYNKEKGRFSIPGFRKGKAPQMVIEKMYGPGVFYEEAANQLIDKNYTKAAEECEEEITSRPTIDVVQIGKGKPFIFTATVALKPEVTLGQYKGLEVEKVSDEVTDADVDAELARVQNQNARLVSVEDRPVADGDETVIDFEGFIDGKPFEGGKGTDYPLTIGSHSFIDTFEEQLIGKKIGEECEVNVTFPEEYHAEELKGKPATFKVTVKEIKVKELPELNDEFAGEVSDFDTLDEYKADIKAKLAERKANEAKSLNEDHVIEKAVENASMEIPDPMLESQCRNMLEEYARRLQSQGLSFDQYMKYTGQNVESMMEQMKPEAIRRIKVRLVLEAVAEAEKIEVSEEEIDAEYGKMAEHYKMEAAKLKELMGPKEHEMLKKDLAVQKAVDLLVKEANFK